MIKIVKIEHIKDYILRIKFDEGTEKTLDFCSLTTFDGVAEPLKDTSYFKNVAILRNGRSFGWDNGYDCCADWAYKL
jgi:hypothetical protein